MMTRRNFNRTAGVVLGGASLLGGCSQAGTAYEELVAATWKHSKGPITERRALMEELVRCATLAANSHNTQPWLFQIGNDHVRILPDFERRCLAADPDDHHLFASLGCATENLMVAARAYGLDTDVSVATGPVAIRIDLAVAKPIESSMFKSLPYRQCTKTNYDGRQVPFDHLHRLVQGASDESVSVQVFTDKNDLETLLDYVVAGNSTQMGDEAFVQELKRWIRFNESEAVEYRDGLFSATSGNPTLPGWLGGLFFETAFTENAENDRYRDQIRSSAGAIAFVAEQDDVQHWIAAGRSYQRFALLATALGIKHAFINQPVDVPTVREQFAQFLKMGDRRPDLLVRFGYGPEMPRSLRRPLDQVII